MMRTPLLKTISIVLLVGLLTSMVVLAQGQPSTQIPALLYNVGTLQDDGSVLYSVLFYSGPVALEKLTITGAIPDRATLDAVVIAPAAAQVAPDSSNTLLKWMLETVAAQTVLGPFTYHVKFGSTDKQPPSNAAAQASWLAPTKGSIDAKVVDGILIPLDKTGKITLDAKGTANDKGEPVPLQVANTGIWIFAPSGSVSQPTELSFTRIVVDDSAIPAEITDTWWCTLVSIDVNPKVALLNPILIGLPTRQVLTVGMNAQAVIKNRNEKWQSLTTTQALRIAGNGNLAEVMIAGQIPQFIAVGVKSKDRKSGSTSVPASPNGGFQGGQGGLQGGFQFGQSGQGGFQGGQLGGFQGFQGAQFGGNCGVQGGVQGGFQGHC